MALDAGHPVYFMIFFTNPMPGQTLADVRNVQIKFVEEVSKRHPNAPKPAIIGNCQGGWAAALIGAERPDLVGPMVFNGSPLSYWGGVEGVNPMRYLGGLLGGVWINAFLSDLGNGKFDGANLVANFENLNPANTLWTKPYNLYANVDTEEERFLDFEKWWGGFFLMDAEEIHTIVEGLFVGNKLEQGEFELEEGKKVDLKNNSNPVVVFASFGDNITPPQQAFNWIIKTYGTVEEIKRRGQVIVYIEHQNVGHLGIFVSAKIARKEHKEIIASFDILDYLPPGLYRMKIEEDPEEPAEFVVSYIEKGLEDIMALDDGLADEEAFYPVRAVSRFNDTFYQLFVSPWIKKASNELTAETLRQLHPLRIQRYILSDLNPWLIPINTWSAMIKSSNTRQPVSDKNAYAQMEKNISDAVNEALNLFRDMRDRACEQLFKSIYESPWMKIFQPFASPEDTKAAELQLEALRRRDADQWRKAMAEGEFPEAIVRILLAVGFADQEIQRQGYELMGKLIKENRRLQDISPQDLQQIVLNQARILQTDMDQAIDFLARLLPTKKDRREAAALIKKAIKLIDRHPNPREKVVLEKIAAVLHP